MTTLHAELYDALLAAQVPDDKARAAASTLPSINQIVKREDLKEFITGKDLRSLRAELRLCATKEDLQRFATKEDLQSLETKVQLCATKEDLLVSAFLRQSLETKFEANMSHMESRLLTKMFTMMFTMMSLMIVAFGVLMRFILQMPV